MRVLVTGKTTVIKKAEYVVENKNEALNNFKKEHGVFDSVTAKPLKLQKFKITFNLLNEEIDRSFEYIDEESLTDTKAKEITDKFVGGEKFQNMKYVFIGYVENLK